MAHFDPSDDFSRLIDRLEPVQLLRRGDSGEALLALRQPIAPRQPRHDVAELVWLFSAADVSQPPCPGDTIVDASGSRYAILDAQPEGQGTRWRCETRLAAENETPAAGELLQAIHARWAASAALCALLPATRVFFDLPAEGVVPSAQVTQESCKPLMRYGDGTRVEDALVRMTLYAASAAEATALRGETALNFDCVAFPLAGGGRVLDMQLVGETRRREHTSLFAVTLDFQCLALVERA